MTEFLILELKVNPNKKRSRVISKSIDGVYRVDLKAKPIEGRANQELIRYLAELFSIRLNQIAIIRGIRISRKTVRVLSADKNRLIHILDDNLNYSP
jgi:uncharacterized protein